VLLPSCQAHVMFSPCEKCKELYIDSKQCVFTGRELKMDTIIFYFFADTK